MQLTKNFNIKEFACKDGSPVPQELYGNVQILANNLQVLREHINCPIHVLSGYRTKSHNRKVGGARFSQHLTAKASDLRVKEYTPKELYDEIEILIKDGKMEQGGLGLYKTFVHYDTRGYKARW